MRFAASSVVQGIFSGTKVTWDFLFFERERDQGGSESMELQCSLLLVPDERVCFYFSHSLKLHFISSVQPDDVI